MKSNVTLFPQGSTPKMSDLELSKEAVALK